ncbi:MAG: glycosyltransferase family 4 protein [Verrucomicrobia bacterium]|nr:glycosyltransferase family 4 protein [Verrucomicrobiota bacterium]MBU1909883.1 glycosyltransferase family 4 protein [Verrucomicrobiota bacterium]
MKIVYLTFSIIPCTRADSVQSMRMCHGLVEAGHDVVLLAPDRPLPEPVAGDLHAFYGLPASFEVRKLPWIHVLGRAYVYGIFAAWRCRRLRPDLVYSRTTWEAMGACWMGLPTVFESHSPVGGRLTTPLFRRFLKSRHLVRLVVISEALREYYRATHGFEASRLVVARDGADPLPEDLPAPDRWPGRKGPLQVGYFGSLVEGRGLDLIARLAAANSALDFHLVGGRPGQVAYWKERMPGPNVFFHGWVSPRDIPRYLAACDILLAPYEQRVFIGQGDYETTAWMSPMKLFEYMAAGKAIVCSDLPVLREFMCPGENALLCPPDDVAAWQAALLQLSESPGLRARLGERACREVAEKYTWKIRAEKVLAGL